MITTLTRLSVAALAAWGAASAVAADTTAIDRNIRQETRIGNGLESGALTTREAARLERMQAHNEQLQARAMQDGTVSDKEAARIDHAQDASSHAIARQKHDVQTGNPQSASSQRMQAASRRDVAQQTRIRSGLEQGSLTLQEAGRMERQQAHGDRQLARAGRDGAVGRYESLRVGATENRQSRHLWRQKHDGQSR